MNISITPEGTVLKDGEEIGRITGGKCLLNKRPGPTVYKAIKDAADNQDLAFDIAPPNPSPLHTPMRGSEEVEQARQDRALSDAELLALVQARGLIPAAPAPARPVNTDPTKIILPVVKEGRQALNNLLKRAEAGEIPPCPPFGPYGDKTPEVVAWVKHYGTPEQFQEQYGGRSIGNPNEKPKVWMKNELTDNDD